MRVTLIVNPDAGDREHEGQKLAEKLRRHADHVHWASSKDDYRDALREPADVVIVAGGDGTVAKVARELIGTDTPMLIFPFGTANNIARTLGIEKIELDLEKIRSDWRKQSIDAAMVDDKAVFEGAGCGAVADLIRLRDAPLEDLPAFDYRITIDGRDITGVAVLIEVMIIKQVGPSLRLAPDADPSDGLLDLVIADERERDAMRRYLAAGTLPKLMRVQGSSLTIACDAPWHFDDKLKRAGTRTITVRPAAWQALVPTSRQ
jgi:diacylglycerol kinase (ATP)